MNQDYYSDARFKLIGDLPSGFFLYDWKELYIRPFSVKELPLLSLGAHSRYNGVSHLLRAVDITITQSVLDLTDGDFEFIIAWLRKYSFPSTPLIVKWHCINNVWMFKNRRIWDQETPPTKKQISDNEMFEGPCDTNNVEIVHNSQMRITSLDDDWRNDDPELDLPRMRTYSDYYEHVQEQPHYRLMGMVARYVRAGETYRDKLAIVENDMDLYDRAYTLMEKSKHGIYESMTLKCRSCDNKVPHTALPNYRTFFPESNEQEIADVQYNLMTQFHTPPNDNMSSLTLFYHHSCLVRDKKEEEQRRQTAKSAKPWRVGG